MKYEYLCGYERLFDGAPEEATHATKGGGFYNIENMSVKYVSDGIFNCANALSVGGYLIAGRRIIAEPKRWTVADQKAGRLPEVGCFVATIPNFDCTVVGVDEERKNIAIQYENGKLDVVRVHCVSPIETPEEKAQREEDEFIDSLKSVEINDGTVRSFFAQGARAAYRKLKGGE